VLLRACCGASRERGALLYVGALAIVTIVVAAMAFAAASTIDRSVSYVVPLTGGRELSTLTGYPLFHNHLVVDAITAVFPFGTLEFRELREQMWLAVMGRAAAEGVPGLIFTFTPERGVSDGFIPALTALVTKERGRVVFVELACAELEIERHMQNPLRTEFGKIRWLAIYRNARESGTFAYRKLPGDWPAIDTGMLYPLEAATEVVERLG